MKRIHVTLALGLLLAPAGCDKKPKHENKTASAATAAPAGPPRHARANPRVLRGKVLEVKDGGGYTYLKLETAQGQAWAAVQRAAVKPGQVVSIAGAMQMKKFKSKALDRVFDSIYFGRVGQQAGTLPQGHPPMGKMMPPGHPGGPGKGQMARAHSLIHGKPAELKAPVPRARGGMTVAEIHAQRKQLAGKPVTVRGQVVKLTPNVMGRNWVHIQDGSGKAASRNFDLTVTTQDQAKVGDVVLVQGVVRADKDFGAGYSYRVIIENAKLER